MSQNTVTNSDSLELRLGSDVRPVTPFVSQFIWRDSLIRGGFSWAIWFQADAWYEWNPILLGRTQPRLQFRLATREDRDGADISTEWRTGVVDSSRAMFKGSTLLGYVAGGDVRLNLQQIHRTRSWDNVSVADVARVLAQEHGLDPVVEETSQRHGQLLQIHETDWDFLRRVVYEDASQSGRGDLYLWIDEGELHLGAPVLQLPSDRRHDMDQVENRVERILLSYAGRNVDRLGGATLRGVGFDFDAKRGIVYDLDASAAQTHPSLAGRVPRAQDGGLRIYPMAEDSTQTVEGRTRGRWGRFAPRYFGVRLDTRPDLALRPGRIVEMQATLGENQETPFLGRFVVLEVEHRLERGAITTTAACYRREAFAGAEEPLGSRAENVRTRDPYRLGDPGRQRVVVTAEVLD